MAEFRLHCFAQSGNAYKIALFLTLVGADWKPVFVDFFAGDTRAPDWRHDNNEMGEVPVLEHRGQKLTQSGMILHYLSDLFGKYGGRDDDEKREILRWILFDNHKFTSYFVTHRWIRTFAKPLGHPEVIAFFKTRTDAALGVVEKHLAQRDYIVGDRLTIADFSMIGYMFFPTEETGYDLAASHPRIHAWSQRIAALPGWRHPYDMLPAKPV